MNAPEAVIEAIHATYPDWEVFTASEAEYDNADAPMTRQVSATLKVYHPDGPRQVRWTYDVKVSDDEWARKFEGRSPAQALPPFNIALSPQVEEVLGCRTTQWMRDDWALFAVACIDVAAGHPVTMTPALAEALKRRLAAFCDIIDASDEAPPEFVRTYNYNIIYRWLRKLALETP